jgi:hypothetical protein
MLMSREERCRGVEAARSPGRSKRPFANSDSSHPFVKPFRRRLSVDHHGSGFYSFCVSYSRRKKTRPIPRFQCGVGREVAQFLEVRSVSPKRRQRLRQIRRKTSTGEGSTSARPSTADVDEDSGLVSFCQKRPLQHLAEHLSITGVLKLKGEQARRCLPHGERMLERVGQT